MQLSAGADDSRFMELSIFYCFYFFLYDHLTESRITIERVK